MKKRFEDRIKEAGNAYRPEPKLQWSDIESRLNNSQRTKRISMRRWLAFAASIAILIASVFIFLPQSVEDSDNSLFVQSSTISDLQDLQSDHKEQAKYSVSELYYAYHEAGLLPSRH